MGSNTNELLCSAIQAIGSALSVIVTTIYVVYTNKLVHIQHISFLKVILTEAENAFKVENIGPVVLNVRIYIFIPNVIYKIKAEGIDAISPKVEPVSCQFKSCNRIKENSLILVKWNTFSGKTQKNAWLIKSLDIEAKHIKISTFRLKLLLMRFHCVVNFLMENARKNKKSSNTY